MEWKINNEIYKRCKSKKLSVNHACEVGVYLPETSNVLEFILEGVRTTLVEPVPKNVKAIREFFKNNNNVNLIPKAIFDYNGVIELSQRESSTFVSSLPSTPALVNDHYVHNDDDDLKVECQTFDTIDDGSIDLLSVDTEGCEWYVIKNLVSRPMIISIETHGKSYINPFIKEISDWTETNHYVLWFKDHSDSIYIKKDLITISPYEKLTLGLEIFFLAVMRMKYKMKEMINC
jgi:FkbM family methyltransferase